MEKVSKNHNIFFLLGCKYNYAYEYSVLKEWMKEMDERNLISINKNKEPEVDTYGYYLKLLESFPKLERDVLKLRLGLGEPFEVLHTIDEIVEILNEPKAIIEKNLLTGLKRMRDNSEKERLKQENEDAYFEIRLQMHNRLIKKLRLLQEEWKQDNISQVIERIMLAFFKNDLE